MRSLLIIGLLVVLLIVGVLSIRNMGVGESPPGEQNSAQSYTQRAEDAAQQVQDKIENLQQQLNKSN